MRREGNDITSCASKSTIEEIESCAWNVTVADYVTRLMINGQDEASVKNFLSQTAFQDSAGKYIVQLNGWQNHV